MTDEPSLENKTNRTVEDAAVAFVVASELEHGRVASGTRGVVPPSSNAQNRRPT